MRFSPHGLVKIEIADTKHFRGVGFGVTENPFVSCTSFYYLYADDVSKIDSARWALEHNFHVNKRKRKIMVADEIDLEIAKGFWYYLVKNIGFTLTQPIN